MSNTEIIRSQQLTFFLENYPNPFKARTFIRWQTPVGGWQTLKIYDIFGKEISTLADGYIPADKNEAEFSGNLLQGECYFYHLRINGIIETRKM